MKCVFKSFQNKHERKQEEKKQQPIHLFATIEFMLCINKLTRTHIEHAKIDMYIKYEFLAQKSKCNHSSECGCCDQK